MGYIVQNKDGVLNLATGRRWRYGQRIAGNELPRRLLNMLETEGAIIEEDEAPPEPESRFNDLLLLEGMTPERKHALSDLGIDTVEQLANAPETKLIKIKGIGPATIKKWKEALEK